MTYSQNKTTIFIIAVAALIFIIFFHQNPEKTIGTFNNNLWKITLYETLSENYDLSLNFNIKKSYVRSFVYGEKFFNYKAGQSSPGWDFAAYLRYQNDNNFYKILISAQRDEIALWKPSGGFLQIHSSEIVNGKNYSLKASIKNNTIKIYLNNNFEFSYTDNILPVTFAALSSWHNVIQT